MRGCGLALAGLLLLPLTATAHHSVAANFDARIVTELEGEITRVFWRNPHVRFTIRVEDERGQEVLWDIETTSVSTLRRMDISKALVAVGDTVRVAGNPSRRGDSLLYVNNLLLRDGREAVMTAGGSPRWTTDVLGTSGPGFEEAANAKDNRDIFRVWSSPFESPMLLPESLDPSIDLAEHYPLTDAARAALADWNQEEDSPIRDCRPKGMPTIMEQPFPMEFVDLDDRIELRLEEYDLARTIHMSDPPEDPTPVLLGISAGRWEGDALIVTTNRISWRYFDTVGIPLIEDAVIVEEFALAEDGGRLDYTVTVTNPGYFTEPVVLSKFFHWVPGVEVGRYDCTVAEGGSTTARSTAPRVGLPDGPRRLQNLPVPARTTGSHGRLADDPASYRRDPHPGFAHAIGLHAGKVTNQTVAEMFVSAARESSDSFVR